ncbi:MAG: hypothetical protein GC189_13625 [Alphaproteobacteria bacterium]|nr:hypothetical protein [Alphaproteobacteria bacterium]
MKTFTLALIALSALGGCAVFEGAWDSQAVRDCREETAPDARRDCLDRADDVARNRDRPQN